MNEALKPAALSLRGVVKSFGGVRALKGVDLDVRAGEIHALLGENGAGKSTLMKVLSGIHQPDAGEILIDGRPLRLNGYAEATAAGIGTVFQEFSLVPFLDAVDNIFLGRERTRFGLSDRAAMRAEAAALFARLGVELDLAAPVSRLSVAQQQFVEIAKALALDARILVLDEPTATLSPGDTRHLFSLLRTLRAQGVAVIFISHHMEEIFELCDRVTVLRDGERVGDAEVAAVDTAALVRMMIGRPLDQTFPPKLQAAAGPVVLQVNDLQLERAGPVNSFHVRAGEILGFAGLVGSGRTETALAVVGALRAHRKSVAVEGRASRIASPADGLRLGVGLLPENRKTEGLITEFSIRDNISVNNLSKYTAFRLFIRRTLETVATASMMKRLGVKAPDMNTRVDTLSGGNQQKVVLARWLNHRARVLLLDEPTRGVDVGAKAEIYRLMREMSAQGLALVMISSELPEIVGMCDRVAVFRQGRIVKLLEAAAITAEAVIGHATAADPEHLHA